MRRLGLQNAAFTVTIINRDGGANETITIDSDGDPGYNREVDPRDIQLTQRNASKAGNEPATDEVPAEAEAVEATEVEAPTEG